MFKARIFAYSRFREKERARARSYISPQHWTRCQARSLKLPFKVDPTRYRDNSEILRDETERRIIVRRKFLVWAPVRMSTKKSSCHLLNLARRRSKSPSIFDPSPARDAAAKNLTWIYLPRVDDSLDSESRVNWSALRYVVKRLLDNYWDLNIQNVYRISIHWTVAPEL